MREQKIRTPLTGRLSKDKSREPNQQFGEKRASHAMAATRKPARRHAEDETCRANHQRDHGDVTQPHPDAVRASTLPLQGRVFAAARRAGLRLLPVCVRVRLAVHAGERRGGGGAFLLVLVLLRFLLFLVAAHLAFRHGVLRVRGE
jgi:hypothetical protein